MTSGEQPNTKSAATASTTQTPSIAWPASRFGWRFLLRLAIVYGLLILPWPGLKKGYAACFKDYHNTLLAWVGLDQSVLLRTPATTPPTWDTKLWLKGARDDDLWHLEFSSRSWGYLPTAAILALIVATPLTWRRRLGALCWGLILIQLFVTLRVVAAIVYGLSWGGALHLGSTWSKLAEVGLLGFSGSPVTTFVVTVLIWLLVAYDGKSSGVQHDAPQGHV